VQKPVQVRKIVFEGQLLLEKI